VRSSQALPEATAMWSLIVPTRKDVQHPLAVDQKSLSDGLCVEIFTRANDPINKPGLEHDRIIGADEQRHELRPQVINCSVEIMKL
jgi:hypothetical protein